MVRKYFTADFLRAVFLFLFFPLGSQGLAEGVYQMGLNQPMYEYDSASSGPPSINGLASPAIAANAKPIFVLLNNATEVINVSLCGMADSEGVGFEVRSESGATLYYTASLPTSTQTNLCSNSFTSSLNPPSSFRWSPSDYTGAGSPLGAGVYQLRLFNLSRTGQDQGLFYRYDITVTPNKSVNPDPTIAAGRVFAYHWEFRANSAGSADSTDANLYVLVPGGRTGTNYVWMLDLNDFAGYGYDIIANNKGMDAANTPFSVATSGNSVSPMFPIYFGYPANALPPPTLPPQISNFYFIDSDGVDQTISPGATTSIQDTGTFRFDSDSSGTYLMIIDANQDGIFGNTVSGVDDVYLTGAMLSGSNSIVWNGRNNAGAILPDGVYQAQLQARLGEYHFVAGDAETSGGGSNNGLAIYGVTTAGTLYGTNNYWDDLTGFNPDKTGNGGSTFPLGRTSVVGQSTGNFRHTWGDFSNSGFGNDAFVSTYVHGLASYINASATLDSTTDDTTLIGLGKTATVSGNQVTFDFFLENFSTTQALSNVRLTDNLDAVLGSGNYTVAAPTIVGTPTGTGTTLALNSGFNGSSNQQLLDISTAASSRRLGPSGTAQIRVVVTLNNFTDRGFGFASYRNSALLSAVNASSRTVSDTSNNTANPDPDNDNNPNESSENNPTSFAFNLDLGDAPDTSSGTFAGDYETLGVNNGPSHLIVSGLSIGSSVDADSGTLQDVSAQADDTNGSDDENGVSTFPVLSTTAVSYLVNVAVTKTISGNAYLVGYLDFNGDGDFLDAGEKSATLTVTTSGTFSVAFASLSGLVAGQTYARFRLSSTQAQAESSVGSATSGEVEDYAVTIAAPPVTTDLQISKTATPSAVIGGSLSYTITVWNDGANNLVSGITVADTIPTGLTGVTWTCSATGLADCDVTTAGRGSSGTGNVNLTNVGLTADAAPTGAANSNYLTITISATTPSSMPATNPIPNTATVSIPSATTGVDLNTGNNSSTASTLIYGLSPEAGKIIINEVLYFQTGSTAAANDEFIELYNAGASSVDLTTLRLLDGYTFDNDGTGSITGSSTPFNFSTCTTPRVCAGSTTLAPGQYAVIWVGTQVATRNATDATFQAWLAQPSSLNDSGDDVWLMDSSNRILDYVVYGSGGGINGSPPVSLGLWGSTNAPATTSAGQSISLTPNGENANDGRCWEITTATGTNTAASRGCTLGTLPTRDTDTNVVGSTQRINSAGVNNNGVATIDVVKQLGSVTATGNTFVIPYTIRLGNTSTTVIATNVQISENLSLAFASGSPVITVTTPPSATTGCTVNSSFNGTSDFRLLTGGDSLAVSSSCTITFTVTVAYPNAASVPTTPQNNQVYASSLASGPNPGHTFPGGVPTQPASPRATDTSTNSATLPTTANGDTASPTPVTFPKLGIAKAFDRIIPASNDPSNNTYTLVYRFTVENFGSGTLTNLEIFDDVVTQFSGLTPTNYNTWVNVPANAALLSPAATLTRNAAWNGTATSNILNTGQTLNAGTTGIVYISFDVTVNPAAALPNNTLKNNSATARGTGGSSLVVTDTSTNGTDPDDNSNGSTEVTDTDNGPDEAVVTPAPFVKLVKEVRNCGPSLSTCTGTFGLSATGKPGEYLEYRVTFYNLSSSNIAGLLVVDTLNTATPFQEDAYGTPLDKEFQVICPPAATTVTLDKTSTAATSSTLTGLPQVVRVNITDAAACNLPQIASGQTGSVLFKVRIP
jgi:uncharacterized repeat protein (TIGR01451 family)